MNTHVNAKRLILSTLVLGFVAAAIHSPPATAAPAGTVFLAPHRAIYDLKLLKSSGSRGIDAVRGRILYDFSGNACEGYALKFRQVSALDSLEGKSILSDLRSTTWEDGAAKTYRFNSENLLNDQQTDAVDGHAERDSNAVSVSLSKPKTKTFTEPVDAVFPTEHMRLIIAAARAGESILEFPVYDGSETGEKLYNTLTVIGAPIPPGSKPPDAHMPDKSPVRFMRSQHWALLSGHSFQRLSPSQQSEQPKHFYCSALCCYSLHWQGSENSPVAENCSNIYGCPYSLQLSPSLQQINLLKIM